MTENREALKLVFAMGAVIFFCRAFPFLFFGSGGIPKSGARNAGNGTSGANTPRKDMPHKSSSRKIAFLNFVEKIVPPAAMTVLAFNALGGAFRDNPRNGLAALVAGTVTAALHLWKRNALASIFGGTALYMVLTRIHIF